MRVSTWPTVVAVALCAGSLTLPSVLRIDLAAEMVQRDVHAIALLASTIGLSVALAAIASRAASVRRALLWLLLAPVLGILNTVLSLGLVSFINSQNIETVFGIVWLGAIYGAIFGGPLGVVLGLAYAIPIVASVRAR